MTKVRWKPRHREPELDDSKVLRLVRAMIENRVAAFSVGGEYKLRPYGLSLKDLDVETRRAATRIVCPGLPWPKRYCFLESLSEGSHFRPRDPSSRLRGKVLAKTGSSATVEWNGSGREQAALALEVIPISQDEYTNGTNESNAAPMKSIMDDGDSLVPAKSNATTSRKRRLSLFDQPATSVVRWMGKQGWTVEQAERALNSLECKLASATIRIQLRAGAKGERGAPARLDKQTATKLKELAGL